MGELPCAAAVVCHTQLFRDGTAPGSLLFCGAPPTAGRSLLLMSCCVAGLCRDGDLVIAREADAGGADGDVPIVDADPSAAANAAADGGDAPAAVAAPSIRTLDRLPCCAVAGCAWAWPSRFTGNKCSGCDFTVFRDFTSCTSSFAGRSSRASIAV